MSDQSDTQEEEQFEPATQEETDSDTEEEVVLDLDAGQDQTEDQTARVDELREQVEAQREQIEELESLLLDLSTRVADDRGFGVCPECHGPVQKVRRLLGASTIECQRCGEVFHEY
ncbi:MAG: hypothetical protein ABEI39_02705 [Halobacteriales archaeon]